MLPPDGALACLCRLPAAPPTRRPATEDEENAGPDFPPPPPVWEAGSWEPPPPPPKLKLGFWERLREGRSKEVPRGWLPLPPVGGAWEGGAKKLTLSSCIGKKKARRELR